MLDPKIKACTHNPKIGATFMIHCLAEAVNPPVIDWNKQEPQPRKSTLTKSQQKKRAKKNKQAKQARRNNRR